jgi:hypothetical protein
VRRFDTALRRVLPLGMVLLTLPGLASAQTGRQWISTDGSPPDTPAEVKFDAQRSSSADSFFDVFIHGFYLESLLGPDGKTYWMVDVPGLEGDLQQVGAPELPAINLNLALPMGVRDVNLATDSFFDVFVLSDFLPAPEYFPGMDQSDEPPPRDPVFTIDPEIYGGTGVWPPTAGTDAASATPMMGSIDGVQLKLHPMRWDVDGRDFLVWRRGTVHYTHPGPAQVADKITKERGKLAQATFHNWEVIKDFYPLNPLYYEADFLFVYPQGYREELLALILQKWARGFFVTEEVVGATGNTCASISALIDNWYASTPANRDKYCLLVGDTSVIPTCTSPALGTDYPSGVASDDPYASTNGLDLAEEVWLGRLSVDSETDCADQVGKILAYEDSPFLLGNYDEALLVAHRENAPLKYVGAHESVRTAAYATPPSFTTLYGHMAGVDDADVNAQIDAGLGLVAYRGHGNQDAWTGWNTLGEDYNGADVGALTNSLEPVVWSFACTNQKLSVEDCVGEIWMERANNGAVSHYGATVASYTEQNHELDRRMFKGVYDLGYTTQSHAIWYAEVMMAAVEGSENAWMYLLLGDPDMQIRRRSPIDWNIVAPLEVPICPTVPCDLTVGVFDPQGMPMPEILVALYKPEDMGGPARGLQGGGEVFDNRYTDDTGEATIPASPMTTGRILYTVQDDQGNSETGSIEVTGPVGVEPGSTARLAFRALPSITSHSTFLAFGHVLTGPATVTIYNLSGRAIRRLEVPGGVGGVTWDGRTSGGDSAPSGLYLARFSDDRSQAVTRVVVTR